jgi:hypothetical protein
VEFVSDWVDIAKLNLRRTGLDAEVIVGDAATFACPDCEPAVG